MDYLLNYRRRKICKDNYEVLNLIINGLPSKLWQYISLFQYLQQVLNLIINGLPSKPVLMIQLVKQMLLSFKPYYKWITF